MNKLTQILATKADEVTERRALRSLSELDAIDAGPVRGFGTTLIAGIVTTVITSIFVTRYLIDLVVAKSSSKSISI